MGIQVHALPKSESFSTLVETLVDDGGLSILCLNSVEEPILETFEKQLKAAGLEVKRVILQMASQLDLELLKAEKPTVLLCQCYDNSTSVMSGARIAALIEDSTLVVWSDTDFLRTVNHDAPIIGSLSYGEADELLTYKGKAAIAEALRPAMSKGIKIFIRCLKEVTNQGTLIAPVKSLEQTRGIKCICVQSGVTLISVERSDTQMISRIFSVLKSAKIEVQLLARASGDSSMTLAVLDEKASECRLAIKGLFSAYEASFWVKSQTDCSIVIALGEGMTKMSGVCGRFFGALGKASLCVKAFAQGLYERSICAVVATSDEDVATQSLNAEFFGGVIPKVHYEIENKKELFLGIFGIGNIGTELMRRVQKYNSSGKEHKIVVCFLANSKRCLVDLGGIQGEDWRQRFENEAMPKDDRLLMEGLGVLRQRHLIAVADCTASGDVPELYSKLMSFGINVVAANKIGVSGSQEKFDFLMKEAKVNHCHFGFEATVGAGLPVIRTVKDLAASGESIQLVEGSLSGTLSWIFASLTPQMRFSDLVLQALAKGYCEPDPRTDLCGADAGRKAAILSHYVCPGKSFDDVKITPLFPPQMAQLPKEEFLKRLPELDKEFSELLSSALSQGKVLRYISTVTGSGQLECALKMVPQSSPLASGAIGDCAVVIFTEHYTDGLAIVGKGAGAGVTGNAIMADLARIMG